MPVLEAAGVYAREIDQSLFVEAFSPTVAGAVGTAKTGPVNEPTLTTSPFQWLTTFGPPVSMGGYFALQFLRRVNQFYYQRVAGSGAVYPESEAVPGAEGAPGSIVSTLGGPFEGLTASTAAAILGSVAQNFTLRNETKGSWTGGGPNASLATLQAISDGDLKITLDGTQVSITGITFAGTSSLADVAQVLEAAIATAAGLTTKSATVTVPASGSVGFKITSDAYGVAGSVAVVQATAGGTDLWAALGGNGSDVTVTGVNGTDLLRVVEVMENPSDTNDVTIDLLAAGESATVFTAAQVAALINAELLYSTASAYVSSGTKLKITHNTPGAANTIQVAAVTNGTAHTTLGLAASLAAGTDGTDRLVLEFVNDQSAPDGTVIVSLGEDPTATEAVDAINAAIEAQLEGAGTAQVLSTTTGQLIEIHTADTGPDSTITVGSVSSEEVIDATGFVTDSAQAGGEAGAETLIFRERYLGDTDMSVRLFYGSDRIAVTNETFLVVIYQGTVEVGRYDNCRKTAATADEEDDLFENKIGTADVPIDPYITVESIEDGGVPVITDASAGDLYELTTDAADPSGLTTVSTSDFVGVATPLATGLQAFRDTTLYEITMLAVPGISTDAVHRELIDIAETRQDCLALIDPPQGLTAQQVRDWHNAVGSYASGRTALNSSYAALYWPWVRIYDSILKTTIWSAPSGHAAQAIAYTHGAAEPWFAPAGLKRGGVPAGLALEVSVTDGDRAALQGNLNRVNTFVNFAKKGIFVYSEKTLLRQSSQLANIHVRFLLIIARKAIVEYLGNYVFDPNDPITWHLIENGINPFLRGIANSRGLREFRVICNEQTNTADRRNRNEGHVIILLQPVTTMEKILTDFTIVDQNVTSLETTLF